VQGKNIRTEVFRKKKKTYGGFYRNGAFLKSHFTYLTGFSTTVDVCIVWEVGLSPNVNGARSDGSSSNRLSTLSNVMACFDSQILSPLSGTNFRRFILDEFFTDSRPLGLIMVVLGSTFLPCACLADMSWFYSAFFSSKCAWTSWVLDIDGSTGSKTSMIRMAAVAYRFIGPIQLPANTHQYFIHQNRC
jgi:hypothetical protein